MSQMQRTKGANGERELCRLIHEHLGVRMVRNLEQSRAGGHDLIPDPELTDPSNPVAMELSRYAFEVKRHARTTPSQMREWWTQTRDQAQRARLLPCLCYREDRHDWRVVLPLSALRPELEAWDGLEWTADLSLAGFACLIREGV